MNVQNLPRDDKVVKKAIVPKLEAFFFADYPNIELKLLAFYLEKIGHPSMAEVFRQGADLHKVTAAGIFKVPVDSVSDIQRQIGKRLNFSIVYGGGVPTLTEQLKIERKEALELLREFHKTWPGIGWATKFQEADPGTLIRALLDRVERFGYITTLWGRHLHPRSAHSTLNALCQGCAADLKKWALIQVHRWCLEQNLRSHLVNEVHDEIMMDALLAELPLLARRVPELMTYDAVQAVVPIKPEPDVSHWTWADKEAYAISDAA